jgi:hypothetical protein
MVMKGNDYEFDRKPVRLEFIFRSGNPLKRKERISITNQDGDGHAPIRIRKELELIRLQRTGVQGDSRVKL